MKSIFLEDMSQMIKVAKSSLTKMKGERLTSVVAIFDLPASTPLKLEGGHTVGTRAALMHNIICRTIVEKFGGTVVKELGDGLLCKFDEPVNACLAAINIKQAASQVQEISTKGGLVIGSVERINVGGVLDILGDTVDRCARIQAYALPGQILIDRALHDVVVSFLKDYPDIQISPPLRITVVGIGTIEVYELSTKKLGVKAYTKVPFRVYEEGRLSIQEKVAFMKSAQHEVIELGVGLTTWTGYFINRRSSEFKEHVIELLRQGVRFKCVALNPDCPIANFYAKDRSEPHLVEGIHSSLRTLQEMRNEFESAKLAGTFEVYVYDHFPYFYAHCIDADGPYGRMHVSHYMHKTTRAETPVMELSKSSNERVFEMYWKSISSILGDSSRL